MCGPIQLKSKSYWFSGARCSREEGFLGLRGSWGSRGLPRSTRTAGTHRGHCAQPALYPRTPPKILIPYGTMCKSTKWSLSTHRLCSNEYRHVSECMQARDEVPSACCVSCRIQTPPSQLSSFLHIWWLQQSRLWLELAVYTFSSPVDY